MITYFEMTAFLPLMGSAILSFCSYRKVVSNNCTAGVSVEYTARRQQCPVQAPKGLHLVTSEGSLTATLGSNVTFLVFLEEVGGFLFFHSDAGEGWLCVCACLWVCVCACARALACRPKWTRRKFDPQLSIFPFVFFVFFENPLPCTAELPQTQCLFM